MELAKSKIKFPEVRAPGGLRPRKTGFRVSDSGQGGVGETLTAEAGKGKGVACHGVDTSLMEAFPVF